MKNKSNVPLVQLIGIIAIVAVIGFSIMACGGDNDKGDNKDPYTPPSSSTSIWTDVTNSTFSTENGVISGIAYGNGKFVAVGWNYLDNDEKPYRPKMAYSSDGVNWTSVTNTAFTPTEDANRTSGGVSNIAYGSNKFIAVGGDGQMAYSSDGVAWTSVVNNPFISVALDPEIRAIAYGNNKFVAGNFGGKMAYSSDGVTWTSVTNSPFTTYIIDIAYGNGKFVAVGDNNKMATSSDGETWISASTLSIFTDIRAIAYGNNKFVAVGFSYSETTYLYTPKIVYSSDNETWTPVADTKFVSDGNENIQDIAYGNGKFVIIGSVYTTTSSSDGITWTLKENYNTNNGPTHISFQTVAYGNNKFVAGGRQRGTIAYWDGN